MMIPEMQQSIHYITMKLEDNERGNITRLMKSKEIILAKTTHRVE
jgi:V/A-type H+-transporting ATPase subunit D